MKLAIYILVFAFALPAYCIENRDIESLGSALISANAYDIELRDNYAYVADEFGLSVWDLSEEDSPRRISRCETPGLAWKAALYGDYAYVADLLRGVDVINIQDPEHPELTGILDTRMPDNYWAQPCEVTIEDTLLYVSNGADGLILASLSDPARPEILSWSGMQNYAFIDTEVRDRYAYIGCQSSHLLIVDISDPRAPSLVRDIYGQNGWGGDLLQVEVDGNRMAVSSEDSLFIYSLASPDDPVRILGTATNGRFSVLRFDGNTLYARGGSLLFAFDLSHEHEIRGLGSVRVGQQNDFRIRANTLVIANGTEGLRTVDRRDPANMVLQGSAERQYAPTALSASDHMAYLADYLCNFYVIDFSDPTSPRLTGECHLGGHSEYDQTAVLADSGYAYVCVGGQLNVVDLGDINNPRLVSRVGQWIQGCIISKRSHYLYITGQVARADGSVGNISVYDISDPTNPRIASAIRYNRFLSHPATIAGNLLFQMINTPGGGGFTQNIVVYSIENPVQPRLLGAWPEDAFSTIYASVTSQ